MQYKISLPIKPPEGNGGVILNVLQFLVRFSKKYLHAKQRRFFQPRR